MSLWHMMSYFVLILSLYCICLQLLSKYLPLRATERLDRVSQSVFRCTSTSTFLRFASWTTERYRCDSREYSRWGEKRLSLMIWQSFYHQHRLHWYSEWKRGKSHQWRSMKESPAALYLSRDTAKPTKLNVRSAKTHISRPLCTVWSETSIDVLRIKRFFMQTANSDQTVQMRKLNWVFAVRAGRPLDLAVLYIVLVGRYLQTLHKHYSPL